MKNKVGSKDIISSYSIIPGYVVLVIDINILLSSLSMLVSVIKSLHWTIIMELDGLLANSSQLDNAVQVVMTYIFLHFKSHPSLSVHWYFPLHLPAAHILQANKTCCNLGTHFNHSRIYGTCC